MQTINSVDYDPLTKPINIKNMKIVKSKYKFDFDDKIKVWIDTLYNDSNLSKSEFKEIVTRAICEFCK